MVPVKEISRRPLQQVYVKSSRSMMKLAKFPLKSTLRFASNFGGSMLTKNKFLSLMVPSLQATKTEILTFVRQTGKSCKHLIKQVDECSNVQVFEYFITVHLSGVLLIQFDLSYNKESPDICSFKLNGNYKTKLTNHGKNQEYL